MEIFGFIVLFVLLLLLTAHALIMGWVFYVWRELPVWQGLLYTMWLAVIGWLWTLLLQYPTITIVIQ